MALRLLVNTGFDAFAPRGDGSPRSWEGADQASDQVGGWGSGVVRWCGDLAGWGYRC